MKQQYYFHMLQTCNKRTVFYLIHLAENPTFYLSTSYKRDSWVFPSCLWCGFGRSVEGEVVNRWYFSLAEQWSFTIFSLKRLSFIFLYIHVKRFTILYRINQDKSNIHIKSKLLYLYDAFPLGHLVLHSSHPPKGFSISNFNLTCSNAELSVSANFVFANQKAPKLLGTWRFG